MSARRPQGTPLHNGVPYAFNLHGMHRGNEISQILDARAQEPCFVLACSRSLAVSGDDLRRQLARGEGQHGC